MYKIGLVLQQVVDALDDVSFAEHDLIPHGHELVFHLAFQTMHKVYASVKKVLEEFLLDVAPVGEHLSVEFFCEHFPYTGVPVINIGTCETECYNVPLVVAHQVQLEAVTPSHRALPVLGQAGEHLVEMPPYVVAHGYHRAVHEGYPCALPEGVQFHEQQHVDEYLRHELHKAVVGDRIGELTSKEAFDAVQIILLEVAVGTEMIADEDGHYLAPGELAFAVPVPFAITLFTGQREFFRISMSKFLSNSSIIQKNSVTLSLVIIAYIICNYLIFSYKDTKYLRDYQFF